MIYQLKNKNNIAQALPKIKTKSDYIMMLMNVCDYILSRHSSISKYYNYTPELHDILITDSRLFIFYNAGKYVTTYFPMRYSLTTNQFYLGSKNIDRITISHIRNIMYGIEKLDSFQRIEEECNSGVSQSDIDYVNDSDFMVAKQLLEIEPGYVRFDYDRKNQNGRVHPLYHLDINYNRGATYKIGLNDYISPVRFYELFNNNLEREFLEDSQLFQKDKARGIQKILISLKSNRKN